MRQKHFPSNINYIDAHLMLFHNLPAAESSIIEELEIATEQISTFLLNVADVVCIGRGVAYKIASPKLAIIHSQLQKKWQQWLIPQDRQKLWPHITIQNKVDPLVANMLAKELSEDFEPFEATATGIQLWAYLGGPWEFIKQFNFNRN